MITETLLQLLTRDLTKLRSEISLYTDEGKIWIIDKKISNSAGNLCLHLVGNLNNYIGAELGGTGYIRDRDLEFSARNIPRKDLLIKIDGTLEMLRNTLPSITDADLQKEYPKLVLEKKTSTEFLLIHLATHLTYHLGQINYHRRLLDN